MDSERIDRWCERGIFGLTLLILVFGPLAIGAVRWFEFIYIQAAAILIAVLWIIRAWTKPTFEVFWPPICWPVVAFLIYALIRYRTAEVEYVARLEFLRICVYAVVFLAAVNNFHRQEFVQAIVWTLLGLATAISLYGLYQFATNAPTVWHFIKPATYVHRGSGTFINPNHLAGFLEMILPLGLAMVLTGRLSHVARIILAYACALLLVGIGISLSRGGWIATSLTLICFFVAILIHSRSRWIIISVLLCLFVGMAFYLGSSIQFQNRFQKTFASGKFGDSRIDYWKPAVQMWKENPWTGVGPAHFDVRFPKYRPKEVQARPQYVHNDYLNLLADWGVLGAIMVVAFVVTFYVGALQAAKYLRRKTDSGEGKSNRAAIVFGGGFGLLALLLHSVTDFNMQIPGTVICLLTILAVVMTQLRYSDQYWIENKMVGKVVLPLFLLGLIGILGFFGVHKAKENFWLQRAQNTKSWDVKIDALRQAAAVEPHNPTTMSTLGDLLRQASFRGEDGYKKQAEEALTWYGRAMELNRHSPYNYLGYGMCLDWLGRAKESPKYFTDALQLDPNNYYVVAHQGWHAVQIEDYKTALEWFDKSLNIFWNDFALDYRDITRARLADMPVAQKH